MKSLPNSYPEEYRNGNVIFFGKEFEITPDVLIPRLETESLVRRARQIIVEQGIDLVVDIGAGSGIIGTSLADLVDTVIFLDISPETLRVTEKNFQKHFPGKGAHYLVSDLLSDLPSIRNSSKTLFVTNLPYIKDADWGNMSDDTKYEPQIALFGGEDTGFELYERLFSQFEEQKILGYCLFEFGFDQREVAETTLKKYPQWEYLFFADYAGIERFGEIYF